MFEARWKKDADPNDLGRKMFDPENSHRMEYVETVVDNAARYYITHRSMMKEEWVKEDLDEVMQTMMESGEIKYVLVIICFVH